MNKEILSRIADLENEVSALKQKRAGTETFGLAGISDSGTVTDMNSGLVLSAREKNAAEEGTLAREILNAKNFLPDVLGNIKWKLFAKTITTLHWTNVAKFSVEEKTLVSASVSCSFPQMASNGTCGIMIVGTGSFAFEIFSQLPPAEGNQVTAFAGLPLTLIPGGTEIYVRVVVPKENVYSRTHIYSNVEFLSV